MLAETTAKKTQPLHMLAVLAPGIGLCIGVTAVAWLLEHEEVRLFGRPWLEALVFAIVLGVAIRSIWTPSSLWQTGVEFSAKILLEIAVVLLGASVSVTAVLAIGPALLAGIAIVVVMAIAASYAISRAFGLPQRMSILIACGNSICGNSAIAAVAPVIGADGEDVASSIAFTAVLGVIVVLVLPLLVPLLQMSLTQYGVMAGLTVYAVPQVLAATLPIGALSNQVGTVVKLVRVLMLGPVVLLMSLLASKLRDETNEPAPEVTAGDRPKAGKPSLHQLVPWFIVGFLLVAGAGIAALIVVRSYVLHDEHFRLVLDRRNTIAKAIVGRPKAIVTAAPASRILGWHFSARGWHGRFNSKGSTR